MLRRRALALLCASFAAQAHAEALATGNTGAGSPAVTPAAPTPAATATPDGEELFLEVDINQSPTGQIARFVRRGERFFADADTFHVLGLAWPGPVQAAGPMPLDAIPGITVAYDAAQQRLALTVPLQALDRPIARLDAAVADAAVVDPVLRARGLLLNYSLYGQHQDQAWNLGAATELRLMGVGPGIWSSTMASRVVHTPSGTRDGNVRLDTRWELDWPDRMLSLIVGDSTTAALGWTRATHIGGVRLTTDFSLQPYRVTTPLAALTGEAVLPSTVDLYINGIKQSSQSVQPGTFQYDSVPQLNGTGQAQLVVTDINGQRRVIGFDLYGTPNLLAKGLSDWSLDLGQVRRNYGLRSFDYAASPMFAATGRRGLDDSLTLEGHAEGSAGVTLAGIGAAWLLGRQGGVLSAAISASHGDDGQGHQHQLSYQWSSQRFNAYASTTRASAGYRDVASLQGSNLARRTDQAYLGATVPLLGQLGVNYVRQDLPDSDTSRYAGLTWSRQLPRNGTINLSLNRNLRDHAQDSAYLYWSMPLDQRRTVSASSQLQRHQHDLTIGASQTAPSDQGGWGWRAQVSTGDGSSQGMAEATRIGQAGQWTLGVDRSSDAGSTLTYGSASGSLLWAGGRVHALRNVNDAFAVVSTDGVAGVPVRLENRLVGTTDADGLLLVTSLRAWQNNKVSIDPLDLPADLRLGTTDAIAVPDGHAGVKVPFQMHRVHMFQFEVRDSAGRLLPAGTVVQVQGQPGSTVVGQDGQVFLQDAADGARLEFHNDALQCSLSLPAGAPRVDGLTVLDTQTCR